MHDPSGATITVDHQQVAKVVGAHQTGRLSHFKRRVRGDNRIAHQFPGREADCLASLDPACLTLRLCGPALYPRFQQFQEQVFVCYHANKSALGVSDRKSIGLTITCQSYQLPKPHACGRDNWPAHYVPNQGLTTQGTNSAARRRRASKTGQRRSWMT